MSAAVDRRGNAHLEKNLEEFLRKRVRLVGGYAFKWVPTIAGVPDRMCLFPGGVTCFVELKQKGEKPEPIQLVWHDRLRQLGYRVYVIDDRDGVIDFIREALDAVGPGSKRPGRARKR